MTYDDDISPKVASLSVVITGGRSKTIGDSFMAAFRSVDKALNYAIDLKNSPGAKEIRMRAGIHIGPMNVDEDDVFGGAVNFAARVVGKISGAEIWVSDLAKAHLDSSGTKKHSKLKWKQQKDVSMKGFEGEFCLWALVQ